LVFPRDASSFLQLNPLERALLIELRTISLIGFGLVALVTGAGATGTSNFRGLAGTVSQLSSSTLTITDSTGSDYSVTITPQTRIVETRSVTASSLKVGFALTVSGTANNQSVITARTVMILLKLPTTISSSQTP
jgi:Domain of unknown function (DUF5666)